MQFERVRYEKGDRIAIITINHPPVNALGGQTLRDLELALDAAAADDFIKAIIITGEGRFFVAGADIKEINNITSQEEGERLAQHGQRIFNKIEQMSKPVIAAINGAALGGGMELVMACHLRLAAESAKLGQLEINLGIIPGYGGTQRLPRLTNKAIALEWLLTGATYSAHEAYDLGIINHLYPDEQLMAEAEKLALKIAAKGGIALAKIIKAVNLGENLTLQEGLQVEAQLFGEVVMTKDKEEGVQAFLEKRAPIFQDK